MKHPLVNALALSAVMASSGYAQSIDVITVTRNETWYQTDTDSFELFPSDSPFEGSAEIALSDGTIAEGRLSLGEEYLFLETADGGYHAQWQYPTKDEMISYWPAGTYTVSGHGNTAGNFSFDLAVGEHVSIQHPRITNWVELQSADPSEPVTVEWGALDHAGDTGLIFVTIGHPGGDEDDVWEAPGNRADGLPGLTGDSTSVVIPAGVLGGGQLGQHEVTVAFLSLHKLASPAAFPDTFVGWGTEAKTVFKLRIAGSESYLGTWPLQDGWADTGDWLGTIWTGHAPWVYSRELGHYVYVAEESYSSAGGAWIYIPRPAAEDLE